MRWTEEQLADHLARTGVPGAPNMADTSAPPFALPSGIVIDLPFPPSVNRLWRSSNKDGRSQVYLSPSYVKWKKAADLLMMTGGRGWRSAKIPGHFAAEIMLCPTKGRTRGDIDNRVKAVLDYAQRAEIVADDKHCQRLLVEWVDAAMAPHGCRLTLRACA